MISHNLTSDTGVSAVEGVDYHYDHATQTASWEIHAYRDTQTFSGSGGVSDDIKNGDSSPYIEPLNPR